MYACRSSTRYYLQDVHYRHLGNNADEHEQQDRAEEEYNDTAVRGPVVMNEDDNTKPNGNPRDTMDATTLQNEQDSAQKLFDVDVSWGMMVEDWNQKYPYQSALGTNPGANGTGEELDRNYVHGVLNEIGVIVGMPAH